MKKIILLIPILLLMMVHSETIHAQSDDEFSIPLSNPGQSGYLVASTHRGRITVRGTSDNEVKIRIDKSEKEDDDWDNDDHDHEDKRSGMKKISTTLFDAEIVEENNKVVVNMGHKNRNNIEILVPKNFSLKISTHHNGSVYVENIDGHVEVSAHHGDIALNSIKGSAVVDTHHGEIEVSFTGIDASKPMAFTTYHGDVDISFPGSVSFSPKIKTTKGEIYTDFEMKVQPAKMNVTEGTGKNKNKRKVKIGGWVHGTIGNGGEEYMFSTYHGDVILRKG